MYKVSLLLFFFLIIYTVKIVTFWNLIFCVNSIFSSSVVPLWVWPNFQWLFSALLGSTFPFELCSLLPISLPDHEAHNSFILKMTCGFTTCCQKPLLGRLANQIRLQTILALLLCAKYPNLWVNSRLSWPCLFEYKPCHFSLIWKLYMNSMGIGRSLWFT